MENTNEVSFENNKKYLWSCEATCVTFPWVTINHFYFFYTLIAKFYCQSEWTIEKAICQWLTSQQLEGKSSSESQPRWLLRNVSFEHLPYVWANNKGLTLKTSDLKSSYWSNLTLLVWHHIFVSQFPTEKSNVVINFVHLKKNSLFSRFFTFGNWWIVIL